MYVAIYHIYISERFKAVSVQSWNLLYLAVTMYLSMAKVERMVGCETYAEYLVLRYPYSDWCGADCTSCCWFWKGFWKLSQYDFQLTFNVICWCRLWRNNFEHCEELWMFVVSCGWVCLKHTVEHWYWTNSWHAQSKAEKKEKICTQLICIPW